MKQPQLSPISRMVVVTIAGIVLVPEVLRLLAPSADPLSVSRAALFTIPLVLWGGAGGPREPGLPQRADVITRDLHCCDHPENRDSQQR